MTIGINAVFGRPGVFASQVAQRRNVFVSREAGLLPGGKTVKGSKARDPGNSAYSTRHLRAGLILGKITSGGYYANSILGLTSGALTTVATTLNVPVATAVELVRRVGDSGTFKLTGPPTAAGTVATSTVTYSAVDTTTGAVTITATGVAFVAGSLVQPTDGSETPLTFIDDGYGIVIPDDDTDAEMPFFPVGGVVDSSQLIDYPADASLKTWLKQQLSTALGGKFAFDDTY